MSMGIIAVSAAVLGTAASVYATNKNARIAKDAATDARTERDVQRAELEKEMQAYRDMEIKNPFEGMQNMFAENVYEDITVNQQQAQFQAQQGAQQRANIMQNLQGAAGGSGIAGLAQALANQGQLQTQQISASIGQQEARNQALRAKGALQVQKGAANIQSLERQGAQYVQQAEMDRQATLLSMQMGETTGANLAFQEAKANQMQADIAFNQSIASGFTNIAGTSVGAYQEDMFPGQNN
tara:strand:- start:4084 stop:4803 length:720 start_codon:yes stop_codon:yes gene_type:complete